MGLSILLTSSNRTRGCRYLCDQSRDRPSTPCLLQTMFKHLKFFYSIAKNLSANNSVSNVQEFSQVYDLQCSDQKLRSYWQLHDFACKNCYNHFMPVLRRWYWSHHFQSSMNGLQARQRARMHHMCLLPAAQCLGGNLPRCTSMVSIASMHFDSLRPEKTLLTRLCSLALGEILHYWPRTATLAYT